MNFQKISAATSASADLDNKFVRVLQHIHRHARDLQCSHRLTIFGMIGIKVAKFCKISFHLAKSLDFRKNFASSRKIVIGLGPSN